MAGKYSIYGCGQFFRQVATNYIIPTSDVECFIDNGMREKGTTELGGLAVLTWDEYLKKGYKNLPIVVTAKARTEEILTQIKDSGYEGRIILWDEWIDGLQPNYSNLVEEIDKQELEYNLKKMEEAGFIDESKLANSTVLSNREMGLREVPENAVIAEIGVAFGAFSQSMLEIAKPKKMYAIDIFNDKTTGFWGDNVFAENNTTHFEWYKKKFEKYVSDETLEMKKGLSWDIMAEFPDGTFDYVYLDAAHDYDSVVKDIEVLKHKVKDGGIIQFNDYTFQDAIGVAPAVNKYVNETASEVIGYCLSKNGFDDIIVRNIW